MDIGLGYIGIGIAAGIAVLGAGLGIGKIGGSATEGISRQPDAAAKIQTAMIISAALIEGVALFALVVAFLAGQVLNTELPKTTEKKANAVVEQAAEGK